jgi:hypothetical protein
MDQTISTRRRRCGRCRELKHSDEFSRDKHSPDGRNRTCRVCESVRKKRWYGSADDPDATQDVQAAAEACELCGQSWKGHPRCRLCSIGLGEGHLEGPGVLLEGQAYCGDCARRKLRAWVVTR